MSDPIIEIKLVGDESYLQSLENERPRQEPPVEPAAHSSQRSNQQTNQQPSGKQQFPDTGRKPDWFPDADLIDRINAAFRNSERKTSRKIDDKEEAAKKTNQTGKSPPKQPEPVPAKTPDANAKKPQRPKKKEQSFEEFEKRSDHRLADILSPAVVRRWTDHFLGRGILGQTADTFANKFLKKTRFDALKKRSGGQSESGGRRTDQAQEQIKHEQRRRSIFDRFSDFLKSATPERQKNRREQEFSDRREQLAALRLRADRQIRRLTGKETDEDRAADKDESERSTIRRPGNQIETTIGKFTDALGRGVDSMERTFINASRRVLTQVRGVITNSRRLKLRTDRQVSRGLSRITESRTFRKARIATKKFSRSARQTSGNLVRDIVQSLERSRIGRGVVNTGRGIASQAGGLASRIGSGARGIGAAFGGGAAAGAGGATAGGGMAGLGGAAAGAGIAVAAFAAIVIGAVFAFKKVVNAFESQADELEEYSGAIVAERLKIQAERVQSTVERARRIERPVARVEASRGRFEDAIYDLTTEFKETFSEVAPLIELVTDGVTVMVRSAEVGVNHLQAMVDYAMWDFEGAAKNKEEAAVAEGKLLKAVADLAVANDGEPDSQAKWLLSLDPFEKVKGNEGNPNP